MSGPDHFRKDEVFHTSENGTLLIDGKPLKNFQRDFKKETSELISQLASHTADDVMYLEFVRQLAMVSTDHLTKLCVAQNQTARKVAGFHLTWPVLLPPSQSACNGQLAFLDQIGVGANPRVPVDAQKFVKTATPSRYWVFDMIEIIDGYRTGRRELSIFQILNRELVEFAEKCRALPELSLKTRHLWFPLVQELTNKITHAAPESHPRLYKIGASAEVRNRNQRMRDEHNKKSQKLEVPKSKDSTKSKVRGLIFQRLKGALKEIVRDG